MKPTTNEEPYSIDVLPCAEAPWAPATPGAALRWAWRIVDAKGQPKMIGSSNSSEQAVREFARTAVSRLKKLNTGQPAGSHVLRPRKLEQNSSVDAVAG